MNKILNDNWQIKKLGEVCKYNKGKKPKKLVSEKQDNIAIPYINIKAFEKGIFDEYTDGEKCNLCEDGDLLMVWDGARAGFSGKAKKGAVGSTLMKIEPLEDVVEKNFIYYFLQSIYKKLNTNPRGVGIPHVEPTLLWEAELFVPPLETQHAIVSKIEELFSELDKGIAELKTAQQQLKTYRQSVLKSAFEGKLTNENVKDGELPDGWEWKTFSDVCVRIGDIDHKMPKKTENGKYPYLSTKDITNDFKLSFDNVKLISEEDYLMLSRKIKPEKGDIIFPRYGTIGKNVLVDTDKKFLISYSCAIIKPNTNLINEKYIYLFSLSPKVTDEIRKYVVETTQANIGIGSIKSFVFPLAPLEDQHRVVQEIESRLSVADKMEQCIQESLQKAEALRQSILKKAFCGELV